MYSGFSSGLKLTELNDFITPSQECIKPVLLEESRLPTKKRGLIEVEDSSDDLTTTKSFEKAKISLNDCLACSGCITSAEIVLVSQQSLEQFCTILKENQNREKEEKLLVILSVSTQSVLSLAVKYHLSPQDCLEKLVGYFKRLGVDYVFDINFARCFSIIEAQKEFVNRYKSKEGSNLPVLASACPGWVCYAEKAHGSYILPYISKVRSPQQVMGSLIKNYWAKQLGFSPDKVYHATLMPCFDKKLEASRDEFLIQEYDTREVDCVITAVEVEQMVEHEGLNLHSVDGEKLDPQLSLSQNLCTHEGSGSGGFAHHVFRYAAQQLFGVEEHSLTWKALKNNDMLEITLENNEECVLKFAIANGFRNIQNLVQKLKRKKCPYHFVEVMACPSGCLNGGAQIRPVTGQSNKELTTYLEHLYRDLPKVSPEDEERVKELYAEWLGNDNSEISDRLHTTYKEVEMNINPLGIKW